jgi:hypothetical protein
MQKQKQLKDKNKKKELLYKSKRARRLTVLLPPQA